MPDDTPEEQEQALEENQEEPMLSSEEETTEDVEQAAQREAEEEEAGLPEDASERTKKQFEKLTQKNKELSEKLAEKESSESKMTHQSVLDELLPSIDHGQLTQQQVDTISGDLVDANGYVDVQLLRNTIEEAKRQAAEAKAEVARMREQSVRHEQSQQTQRAHEKHPYLDPNNTDGFDKKFYNLVKNELIGQMMNGETDVLKAANKVKKEFYDPEAKSKEAAKEASTKRKATVAKRAQASTPARANRASSDVDEEILIQKTRKGDRSAIYERLKRSGL